MSRKRRKFEMNIPDADKYMSNLKFKDLKRECVIRGMEFEAVVSQGVIHLSNWLRTNFMVVPKHELLNAFDEWQEEQIRIAMRAKSQNPEEIIHSSLRLGYIAETDEDGNVTKRKRVKTVIRKRKKKRDRTSDGIFQGTKKAFTFTLQQQGFSKEEVIKKVKEQYPEASEKSVGIWFNKSRKLHKQ